MNRTNYLYKFQGKITSRRLAQSPPQSKYAGQSYYVLTLQLKDHSKQSIQVFRSQLASPEIWTTIAQKQCFGPQYNFLCKNQKGYYYLVDWQIIAEKQCQYQAPQCQKTAQFQHTLKLGSVSLNKQWVCGNCKQILESQDYERFK